MDGRLAWAYVEGDVLPPTHPGERPQTVVEITDDPLTDGLLFTTRDGSVWSFGLFEQVTFPRHGTYHHPIRWETAPLVRELAVGDRATDGSLVIGVLPWNGAVWQVECWVPADAGSRIYHVHRDERFTLPRRDAYRQRLERPRGLAAMRGRGPYVHMPTGKLVLLAIHPHGRGSWPARVMTVYQLSNDTQRSAGPFICRPPRRPEDWADLSYRPDLAEGLAGIPDDIGFEPSRHPKDRPSRSIVQIEHRPRARNS